MFKLTFALTLILSFGAHAQSIKAPMQSVIDYLRETPALVSGNFKVAGNVQLYKKRINGSDMVMVLHKNHQIDYSFSETHLTIYADQGISLKVHFAGLSRTAHVKSITYFASTKTFTVKTDSRLMFGAGEVELNRKVASEIERLYEAKIIKSFNYLRALRAQRRLTDAKLVITSIVSLFKPADITPSTPFPGISGLITMSFSPDKKLDLTLSKMRAHLSANDTFEVGFNFTRRNENFKVTALQARSVYGLRIVGSEAFPEVASILLKNIEFDKYGARFNYVLGAEEVIGGFILTFELVRMAAGLPPGRLQGVRFDDLRLIFDSKVLVELGKLVREHRQKLLDAGLSPELLDSLDKG